MPCLVADPYWMTFYTSFGALALYLVNRLNYRPTFSICTAINIDVSKETGKTSVILIDLFISAVFAGFVVRVMTDPSAPIQAVFSGLGATGLLAVAAGSKNAE
jgi:hypothetical protein